MMCESIEFDDSAEDVGRADYTGSDRSMSRINRRAVLRTLGVVGVAGLAGCLGSSDDDDRDTNAAEGNDDDGERSRGTAEVTFRGETYTVESVSCDGRRTFPPENEMIGFRRPGDGIEFYVERDMGEGSEGGVEVEIGFPSGAVNETIGEIEAYVGVTTIDEIEFELGEGTSGSLHLAPASLMNDDVDHHPDGGEVVWDISC